MWKGVYTKYSKSSAVYVYEIIFEDIHKFSDKRLVLNGYI